VRDNCTRQLWAEKHLQMAPTGEEQEWVKWYNYLHDEVEAHRKAELKNFSDLSPKIRRQQRALYLRIPSEVVRGAGW
jgi:hypothetical protein